MSYKKQKPLYVACLANAFAIGYKGEPFLYAHEAAHCSPKWAERHVSEALEQLYPTADLIPISLVKRKDIHEGQSYEIFCQWYAEFINNRPKKQRFTTHKRRYL